jgi:hypothetical protein
MNYDGLSVDRIKSLIVSYLIDYKKLLPDESFSTEQHPNWGELDHYTENYPELFEACMEGTDEELELILNAAIDYVLM